MGLPVFDKDIAPAEMDKMAANAVRASNFLKAISHEGRLMIVVPRRDGKTIYYSLADDRASQIMEVVYDLFCRDD